MKEFSNQREYNMILNSIIPILLIICYGCLIRVIVRTVLPAQDKGNKDTPMEKKTKSDIVGKSRYMPLQEASCKTDETPPQAPGNESGNETEVDYIVDNDEPEELEEDDPEDGAAQNMLASGVSFEGLKESIKTADEYENSASQQRRKAGETLLEIHKRPCPSYCVNVKLLVI